MDYVVTGTLTSQAGRLAITAERRDVVTNRRMWGKTYKRTAADLLSIQDEIARAIMDDGLRLRLSSNERRQLVRTPTTDGEAYDLYLQARHLQRRATEDDYLNARQLLQRAIVRDEKFALAHVAIGATYAMMAADGLDRPTNAWPGSGPLHATSARARPRPHGGARPRARQGHFLRLGLEVGRTRAGAPDAIAARRFRSPVPPRVRVGAVGAGLS